MVDDRRVHRVAGPEARAPSSLVPDRPRWPALLLPSLLLLLSCTPQADAPTAATASLPDLASVGASSAGVAVTSVSADVVVRESGGDWPGSTSRTRAFHSTWRDDGDGEVSVIELPPPPHRTVPVERGQPPTQDFDVARIEIIRRGAQETMGVYLRDGRRIELPSGPAREYEQYRNPAIARMGGAGRLAKGRPPFVLSEQEVRERGAALKAKHGPGVRLAHGEVRIVASHRDSVIVLTLDSAFAWPTQARLVVAGDTVLSLDRDIQRVADGLLAVSRVRTRWTGPGGRSVFHEFEATNVRVTEEAR